MILWAFLLCVAFVPGLTGWAIQSGWAFISLTLPWMGGRHPSALPGWVIGVALAALAWAIFSLWFLPRPILGVEQVWYLACLGLVGWWISKQPSLERFALGLAFGLYIGVVVAAIQWSLFHFCGRDCTFIPRFDERPAGLFYNAVIFGNACAVVLTLLLAYGRYFLGAPLALGLVLSGSRGGALALVIGMIAWIGQERKWAFALFALLAIPAWLVFTHTGESDHLRTVLWVNTWRHLTWLPHGPGSLEEVAVALHPGVLARVQYAHNEFLDLGYTYGIGSILLVSLLVAPLTQVWRKEWPAYVCFIATAIWSFPLHYPVEASIAVGLASSLYCGWRLPRPRFAHWRLGRASRQPSPGPVGLPLRAEPQVIP